METRPIAHDDEQGVVDANAEPDHDGHVRRKRRNCDDVTEQGHEHQADADAEDGGHHWKAHGQQRAEGHEQDHDGGQQTDPLGGTHRRLKRPGHDRTAQLDREPRDLHLLDRIDQGLGRLGRQVARLLVEGDGRVGDGAVCADAADTLVGRVDGDDVADLARPDFGKQRVRARRRR